MPSGLRVVLILLALAGLAAGCRGPWYDHRFFPSPIGLEVGPREGEDSGARVLVTVLGIRRPADGQPAKFEVRMRIENGGSRDVVLEGESLELLAADLTPIGSAYAIPEAGAPETLHGLRIC